ncbi:MAG: hypothetical protein N2037_09195 [Acidimicrobiales bacterium]|nr:hypothetical protein [Acidimicrobiales bacterium]
MLDPFDDFLVHQTADSVAVPASGAPGVFDRYEFFGSDPAATVLFGATLGLHPNLGVIDAAFSVVHAGVQYSLYASGRAPGERRASKIDPIAVEVIEPFERLRVRVDPNDIGIAADLVFTACSGSIAHTRRRAFGEFGLVAEEGGLTQWGHWAGTIQLPDSSHHGNSNDEGAGTTVLSINVDHWPADRVRRWGLTPLDHQPGAPALTLPQTFRLRATLRFDDGRFVLVDLEEGSTGHQRHAQAGQIRGNGMQEPLGSVRVSVDWQPGTRRPRAAVITFSDCDTHLTLHAFGQPFPLRGLGTTHPHWARGTWRSEHAIGIEAVHLDTIEWTDLYFLHNRQCMHARWSDSTGARGGVGAIELLALGDHEPTGLRGFNDGAGIRSERTIRELQT